jgi:hypothetical protein
MKRFMMLVGVAVVAAAMYVAASPASQQSKGPTAKQFSALKKQVSTLKSKLNALAADESKVKTAATSAEGFIAACFISTNAGALPVNQFGTTQSGFLFGNSVSSSPRTALDVDPNTTTGAYLQAVDPSCLSTSSAQHTLTHAGNSRLSLRPERSR